MVKVALLSPLMKMCVSVKSRRAESSPFASQCVRWSSQEWDSGSPTSVDFFPYMAWATEREALERMPVQHFEGHHREIPSWPEGVFLAKVSSVRVCEVL